MYDEIVRTQNDNKSQFDTFVGDVVTCVNTFDGTSITNDYSSLLSTLSSLAVKYNRHLSNIKTFIEEVQDSCGNEFKLKSDNTDELFVYSRELIIELYTRYYQINSESIIKKTQMNQETQDGYKLQYKQIYDSKFKELKEEYKRYRTSISDASPFTNDNDMDFIKMCDILLRIYELIYDAMDKPKTQFDCVKCVKQLIKTADAILQMISSPQLNVPMCQHDTDYVCEELKKIAGIVTNERYTVDHSGFKINSSRSPIPDEDRINTMSMLKNKCYRVMQYEPERDDEYSINPFLSHCDCLLQIHIALYEHYTTEGYDYNGRVSMFYGIDYTEKLINIYKAFVTFVDKQQYNITKEDANCSNISDICAELNRIGSFVNEKNINL